MSLHTDHGSILCQRPTTVFARKDATANLRYKFGGDLRAEDPTSVLATNDQKDLGFPAGKLGTTYLLAMEDYLLRLSHQAPGVPGPVPELLPPRGDLT